MARIRSVHPGQWTDDDFVTLSFPARLLAIGLRNEADDQGVFVWKPIQIKMKLFAADNVDVSSLLDELVAANQVCRFDAGGKPFGAIRNFRRWQRPEKPKPGYGLPDGLREYVGLPAVGPGSEAEERPPIDMDIDDPSPTDPRRVPDASPTDPRKSPQRKEEGGRREDVGGEEPQKASPSSGRAKSPDPRGSRIPDDWSLSPDLHDWSISEARAPPDVIQHEVGKFRDYWRGKAGQGGRKTDWDATWRNWIRKAMEDQQHGRRNGTGAPQRSYLAGVAEFARDAGFVEDAGGPADVPARR